MALLQRLFSHKLNEMKQIVFRRQASHHEEMDPQKTAEMMAKISSSWISYGFDTKSEKTDRRYLAGSFFFGITGLVFTVYCFMYAPDIKMKLWAQREAFLELRYREEQGCKLINPNIVDPSTVTLPPEEELCDVEVII